MDVSIPYPKAGEFSFFGNSKMPVSHQNLLSKVGVEFHFLAIMNTVTHNPGL